MINTIVETLATVIDIAFLVWFVPKFNRVSLRKKPWPIVFAIALLTFQLIADHLLQGFDLLYMAGVVVISLCFSIALEHKKILWSAFSALAYVIILMLSSSLVYAVFSVLIDNIDDVMQGATTNIRIIYIAVCKVVQFAFYQLILQLFKKNQSLDLMNGLLSFVFTIATALGLGALMKIAVPGEKNDTVPVLLLAGILVFANIAMYFMIYQVQKLLKSKYELQLIQERMSYEKSRMEEAHTIWGNIQKTKHDLKNHFTVMYSMLDKGQTEDCKTYMDSLYHTIESMGNLIHSGNSVIDYLINSKLSNREGIQVLISGYVGNYRDIEDMDLVAIVGNILDNAVEAQNDVLGTKRIELLFLQKNSNRVIICKNTIKESVLKTNKMLRTTKKSPDSHGLGHQIVETTAKKYGGWVEYFEAGDMFGVEVFIPEKKEQK